MPILRAHRGIFITSLVLSFVGLVLQVQIPDLLNHAIDNSLVAHTVPLHFYVWWILALGLAGGVAGYVSRLFLFQTAYDIEFDLRNMIYEHLTRMSFPFYDRVQSGQLISRANSDIRSVQMYMTFAPMILVQCSIAAGRLRVHAVDQRPARLRRHGHDALRVPRRRTACASRCSPCRGSSRPAWPTWPPSSTRTSTGSGWCESFAARAGAAAHAGQGGRQGAVGLREGRRPPGPVHTGGAEPSPGGPGPGARLRRLHGHPRDTSASAPSWPSTRTSSCCRRRS